MTLRIFALLPLAISSLAYAADDASFQRYQCEAGQSFEVRMENNQLQLRIGWSTQTLAQVEAASGTKYSDGLHTVWLKGDEAMLDYGKDPAQHAKNCSLMPRDEPLTPIRDAASGLIFVPPDRWTAQTVQVDVKTGADIPFYGNIASHQIEYRYQRQSAAPATAAPLLDILVFPLAAWNQLTSSGKTPAGEVLGQDPQRVYLAQLPANNPFAPDSSDGQAFLALQTNINEVKQAFSMYGVVSQKAVESVSAKILWRERRLYPGTVLTVELRDVSKMDVAAELIAKQTLTLKDGAPPTVTLKFAPEAINPKNRYAVSARLEQDGKLIKISDTHTPVLTHGAPRNTDLILVTVP